MQVLDRRLAVEAVLKHPGARDVDVRPFADEFGVPALRR